ncbi:YjhX family toxin [Tabrizicola sp.]|uniref:YjhX family toxin n=1 Tax=Tabrizicola sp. TaxID=2005166 RepID=UPI003F368ACF
MNISRSEQRVLHVMALGGRIDHLRNSGRKIDEVLCVTRDGLILSDCTLAVFQRLRRKRLIGSEGGGPYRITRLGRLSVRAQTDNQG